MSRQFSDKVLATATASDPARALVGVSRGPAATVYSCPFCKHHELIRRPRPGHGDRGFGLRTGGPAHSRMGAHIRAEHWDQLAAIKVEANRVRDARDLLDGVAGLERLAARSPYCRIERAFTSADRVTVEQIARDERFEYRHNGVRIERERAVELIGERS